MSVDRFLQRRSLRIEDFRRSGISENTAHLGSRSKGNIMHDIGTQALRIIYICRFHPQRIAVLPPVDERRLALGKTRTLIINGTDIHFEGLLCHRIDLFQPLTAAGHLIDLPRCAYPDLTVSTARPCSAGSCILHDLPLGVDLAQKAGHGSLRLHVRHAQYGTVADIPCPYTAPLEAGTESSVRLDSIDALVYGHVIDRLLHRIRRRQLGKGRNIILPFPDI